MDNIPVFIMQQHCLEGEKSNNIDFLVLFSYRVDEPYGLVELQKNEWDPVLQWTEKR